MDWRLGGRQIKPVWLGELHSARGKQERPASTLEFDAAGGRHLELPNIRIALKSRTFIAVRVSDAKIQNCPPLAKRGTRLRTYIMQS